MIMEAAITTMTDDLALARLLAWLSPVFPTGSFAYSSGLETVVTSGLIGDEQSLTNWLSALLSDGRLRNDAIFLKESLSVWDGSTAIEEINDLALASAGSAELHLEITAQGAAFFEAAKRWPEISALTLPDPVALPVVVGAACGAASVATRSAVTAYLHAFIANQLQIAIRLSVIGQTAAASLLATLEGSILKLANETETATVDDLGSATIMADIASMQHETQRGRLFRS